MSFLPPIANTSSVAPTISAYAAIRARRTSAPSPTTAAAYSLGQQLVTTTWNQVFAIGMLVWAFGWTSGKELLRQSYAKAKMEANRKAE